MKKTLHNLNLHGKINYKGNLEKEWAKYHFNKLAANGEYKEALKIYHKYL